MTSFLSTIRRQPLAEDALNPPRNNKLLSHRNAAYMGQALSNQDLTSELSRTQQEYFLGLFWQYYHRTMPILHEGKFKEHYESFWSEPPAVATPRQLSPLADIVLAVAVQLGTNFVPRDAGVHRTTREVNTQDASVAGLAYFCRCQVAMTDDLETPSLTTLQCYLLSVVYLNNASFPNAAYQILGLAARIAYILGLHEKPPDTLPKVEQELRRRIWWFLCSLDFKQFMESGRPYAVQSFGDEQYPDDSEELAKLSDIITFCPLKQITCLSFFVHLSKLCHAGRTIYTVFHKKLGDLNGSDSISNVYEDAKALECCAKFFPECLEPLRAWIQFLPTGLQMRRKRNGNALSTERLPVELESDLPLWLQRQRLMLELSYHKILTGLYRFFICFSSFQEASIPSTESHATSCVSHAIVMTSIIHQVLTETDLINGWYDAYYLQWDATLSIIGFIFAHPASSLTPAACKMLDVAVSIFDIYGSKFSAATRAADLTREMKSSAVQLAEQHHNSSLASVSSVCTVPGLSSASSSTTSLRNAKSSQGSLSQHQHGGSLGMSDSMVSLLEDGWPAGMLQANAIAAIPTTALSDQNMLNTNAFDSSWSTLTNANVMAWTGFVDHAGIHDVGDGGMRMFQGECRNQNSGDDMASLE